MGEKVIEVKGLSKSYGKTQALNGVDFEVKKGEFFAFLGPNGAGKSTAINILCTILGGFKGEAYVLGGKVGVDDKSIRSQIGIVFQDSVLDERLTVEENLIARASLYGFSGSEIQKRIAELTDFLGAQLLNRPFGKLSGGQKRRADIARALINKPSILFLDEPTTGLDPQTRKNVWDNLIKMKNSGTTLFLTTHYMEETELADRVAIIDGGRIAATGTPSELKEAYSNDTVKLYFKDKAKAETYLKKSGFVFSEQGGVFVVELKKGLDALPLINKTAPFLNDIEIVKGNMDSVFLAVTGKQIREDR